NYPTDECTADRNLDDSSGSLDSRAFLDILVVFTENSSTDVVFLEVQHHSGYAARELKQFACHCLVKSVDTGNTVTDRDNGTCFGNLYIFAIPLDLLLDYFADFFGSDFHRIISPLL